MRWRLAAVYLVAACWAMPLGVSSPTVRVAASSGPIEPAYFGMHMHYAVRPNDFQRVTPWPNVRFDAWRLVAAYVEWRELEPERGRWDFSVLDRYADLAEKHGIALLYTFGHPPRWASARPDEPTYTYGPGVAAEPMRMSDWENYVRTIVQRYRGRIQAYEIWNEPWFREIDSVTNSAGKAAFYSGTAAKMIELARVVYRVVKEIDPAAKVLTPGFDHSESGARRLDLYLSLGGAAITDAVAFHFYTSSPERMVPIIAHVRSVMAKHGIADRELWNTETGYEMFNADEPGIAPAGRALDEADAGAFVARALVLSAAAGVKRFYWYAWDDAVFGLTRGRGRLPNKSAEAYAQTRRWLLGATVSSCESTDSVQWVCALSRSGRNAWIVWRTEGEGAWTPPKAIAEVETLDGHAIEALPSGSVTTTTRPVLVKLERAPWAP